ncbi:hypothetical protein [Legionella sp. CNM-4043-24]|uniref:hypothetical protein n=1 Tax=Legionella sp. CNM-4043-24 TaxID=3421646 RepID=UPI00403AAAB9
MMPTTYYVVPDTFLQDFPDIRKRYEEKALVSLTSSPQPYGFFVALGATDIETRRKQVEFLESLYNSVKYRLRPLLDFKTETEQQNHISALRILIAGCLYVKAQIDETYTYPRDSSSADLGQVINDLLRLTCEKKHDNQIDDKSREAALLTAKQFLVNRKVFDEPDYAPEKSWVEFLAYIEKETSKNGKDYSDYPCRDFMVCSGRILGEAIGTSTGYVFGDGLSRSEPLVGARQAFTTVLGTGIIMLMGPSARMGVMVLVPTCAGKILDMFCGLSLAYVLGAAMGIAGAGVGWGVGMTMDMSMLLLQKACRMVMRAYHGESRYPAVSGVTLVDSQRIVNGLVCPISAEGGEAVILETKADGLEVKIGEQTAFIPWDFRKLPYMNELRELLQLDVSGKMPSVEYGMQEEQEADEPENLELFPS